MKDRGWKGAFIQYGLTDFLKSIFPLLSMRVDLVLKFAESDKMRYFMKIGKQKGIRVEVIIDRDDVFFQTVVEAIVSQLGLPASFDLELKTKVVIKFKAIFG